MQPAAGLAGSTTASPKLTTPLDGERQRMAEPPQLLLVPAKYEKPAAPAPSSPSGTDMTVFTKELAPYTLAPHVSAPRLGL